VLEALHLAARQPGGPALHLREIARRTALAPSAVQYELKLLRQLGLITDIGTDTRPTYVLDREHAFFRPMRVLFTGKPPAQRPLCIEDEEHFAHKAVRQAVDHTRKPEDNPIFRARGDALSKQVRITRR